MTAAITLTLPLPPTINSAYRATENGRRVRRAGTLAYGDLVWATYHATYPERPAFAPDQDLAITVQVHVRRRRRLDLDNGLKVLIDFLTRVIGVDDSWVMDIHATKHLLPAGSKAADEYVVVTVAATTMEEVA